ncbi:hypothetical protein B0T16DRAFT_392612 [Cercophora newfieldiana]|uniref:Protein kinase domain-containing protein n=1 Tax=Cercophora newfieldiana TaxID=92897 RepID=A0AA40CMQ4_9PEZI|nr:hypothetical protein B0T16DRAFT_392612 [Cercophora newfieldiana]
MQGRYIPRLLAQVYLTVENDDNHNNDNDKDDHDISPLHRRPFYFRVPGILVEYIDGFSLTDLGTTPDIPRSKWHGIIQQAADAARYINDAGVINDDCQPRNVMVQRENLQPFHIDLAQCFFSDDLGWKYFGELRYRRDNQGAIGAIMLVKVKRQTGLRLPEIRYSYRNWGRLGAILSRVSMVLMPGLGIGSRRSHALHLGSSQLFAHGDMKEGLDFSI